jgi:MHS family proline/betaine transporter-like MFS transporter
VADGRGSKAADSVTDTGEVTVTDRRTMRRAVAAATIGNITEWFDFGVYAYLATTLSTVFFSSLSSTSAQIATFGTFAVSFLVRPIGGLFFGPLGDRIGRTKVLAITVLLMAAATFLLGLIPSYGSIGITAPILVILARLLQGFSTGGEYAGAMTFIAEYSADRRRGFMGSFLEFGTLTGYALGASIVTILTVILSPQQLSSWGWRIPFLLALPLGIAGIILRWRLEETPAFQSMVGASKDEAGTKPAQAFKLIFRRHWRALLLAGGLVVAWNVTNYLLTSYMPTYLTATLPKAGKTGVGETASYVLQIAVLLLLIVVVTFLGRTSDRLGRRTVLAVGCAALIVLSVPAVLLLQVGHLATTFAGLAIIGLTLVCFSSTCPSTLPAMFPTEVRYSGLSVTFNVFVSAFGGTTATVVSALVSATGDLRWPGYYLIAAGVVGAVCVYLTRETARRPLAGAPPTVETEQEAERIAAADG